MSIGSDWKQDLIDSAAARRQESPAGTQKRLADADVLNIDDRIMIARRLGLEDIPVMTGRLSLDQLRDDQDHTLASLYGAYQGRASGRFLDDKSFVEGSAPYEIIRACVPKELGCFIVRKGALPDGYDYYLHACAP